MAIYYSVTHDRLKWLVASGTPMPLTKNLKGSYQIILYIYVILLLEGKNIINKKESADFQKICEKQKQIKLTKREG